MNPLYIFLLASRLEFSRVVVKSFVLVLVHSRKERPAVVLGLVSWGRSDLGAAQPGLTHKTSSKISGFWTFIERDHKFSPPDFVSWTGLSISYVWLDHMSAISVSNSTTHFRRLGDDHYAFLFSCQFLSLQIYRRLVCVKLPSRFLSRSLYLKAIAVGRLTRACWNQGKFWPKVAPQATIERSSCIDNAIQYIYISLFPHAPQPLFTTFQYALRGP